MEDNDWRRHLQSRITADISATLKDISSTVVGEGVSDPFSSTTSVEMSSDLNLTALFVLETFEIQLSVIPQGVANDGRQRYFQFR